jgi:4-diphosphocytidyl-2-C-methyl-D-erythritol kinase
MAGDIISTLTLPAPAKLNLFLHITGQRNDGYHLLQTVFQLLDYGDEITLRLRKDGHIKRLKGLASVPEASDLMVRAAKLLQKKCSDNTGSHVLGVDIFINKVLPMGGGIGGGSSDAATVLLGLNKLWDCQLPVGALAELGLQLGADVPVFVKGCSAWAEGVGEQLTPIDLPEKWFVVVHPGVSVSTAEIFLDKALTRDCEAIKIARFLQADGFENTTNVFESVVRQKHPQVARALDWLSQASSSIAGSSKARLTGSGSCLFASFERQQDAQSVLAGLSALNTGNAGQDWQGFIAKGVNQSPVLSVLQE